MLNATTQSFQTDVLNSEVPVLVDFWAPSCGPCMMMTPVLEQLARQYEGRMKIVKLNVEEETDISSEYGVRSIPTLIMFKSGRPVASRVGGAPKANLASFIDTNV